MTLVDLYPVLLLAGALGLIALLGVRHRVGDRVVARRLAVAGIGLVALMMVVSLTVRVVAPGPSTIPSSRLLNWQLNGGGGPALDSTSSASAVTIEVEHPVCDLTRPGRWLADPIVSETSWSVTITMHMSDSVDPACKSQQTPHEGTLPRVGGYLTGFFYTVQLGEPLGGRMLFDGSSFPPQSRANH